MTPRNVPSITMKTTLSVSNIWIIAGMSNCSSAAQRTESACEQSVVC